MDGDLEPRVRGRPAGQQQRRDAAGRIRQRDLAQAAHGRQQSLAQEGLAGAPGPSRKKARGRGGQPLSTSRSLAMIASKALRWSSLSRASCARCACCAAS